MAGLLDGFDIGKDVQAFKQTTNQSLSTVRGDTLTPINTTTQRLNEGVALVNPNDTSLTSRITNFKGQYIEQLNGVVGAISGGLLNVKDITKSIRIGKDGVMFSTDSLLSAVSTQLGYPVSGKTGAMRKIGNTITKEFNRLTGLNMSQLITIDGGKFRVTEDWRGQMGGEILTELQEFAGVDEYLDVSVQTSLYNSILYNSSIFGMSDAYKSLWDNYPYEGLRQDAFIEAIGFMIKNGDVTSVDVVMGFLDAQGKNALLNKYPDFIEKLFTNFKFDKGVLPEDHPALKAKLLAILVRVAGENWMYRETQFGKAYNLGLVSNISDDMVTLLSPITASEESNEYIPLLCCRGAFQEQSALAVLDRSFSDAPIVLMG